MKGINQRAKEYNKIHSTNGYCFEHKFMMEKYLGRALLKNEVVHHINGNKKDNRIENLQVLSIEEHRKKHLLPNRIRKVYPSGNVKVIKNY